MDEKKEKINKLEENQYSRDYLKYNTKETQNKAIRELYKQFNANSLIRPLHAN